MAQQPAVLPAPTSTPDATMRSAPLFVVINGGSGAQGQDERIQVLTRVFREAGRAHEFFIIDDAKTIREQSRKAVALAQAHQGIVVAAGGDGTLNAVAQEVIGHACPFDVIPQGTFNYFGRAHGISQDTETAAHALLHARVEPVQAGLVNGRIFLVNASLGLYPQLLEDREAFKKALGRSRIVALLSGLATLLRERRQLVLEIETASGSRTLRTPTLFVGNNTLQFERLGLERSAAALERGQLAAVAMNPIGSLAMLGLALRGALGQLGDADKLTHLTFRRLTVHPRGHRRIKMATDGEIQWAQAPLVFEVASQPLNLLMPAPADRVEVA